MTRACLTKSPRGTRSSRGCRGTTQQEKAKKLLQEAGYKKEPAAS